VILGTVLIMQGATVRVRLPGAAGETEDADATQSAWESRLADLLPAS
jgi:hypothetical protein